MPKLIYEKWKPREASVSVVARANAILEQYAEQGFDLTLRQLYYQFVARGWIPNRQEEYDKLGATVNKARLAGLIDWNHIEDRTRSLESLTHFRDPAHVIESSLRWFHTDRWAEQPYHVEVWIEKDALVGVIEPTCQRNDVSFFSCRGYTSQSEMWTAGQRLLKKIEQGKKVRILHLGDHDPSGIDMTRDIEERLQVPRDRPLALQDGGQRPGREREHRVDRAALRGGPAGVEHGSDRAVRAAAEPGEGDRLARARVHRDAREAVVGVGCAGADGDG
jgi:hypothetical protein